MKFDEIKKIYNFREKKKNVNSHIKYMLNRTQSMFKYSGLPDSIPEYILEQYLQINGHCIFYEYNDDLYIFCGGMGGEPDVYFRPTIYTFSNPYLEISKSLIIDEDCILLRNDTNFCGLLPLFNRYSSIMVENELSMYIATINARLISHISANDDATLESARKYLEDIESGKIGVIGESEFMDSLRVAIVSSNSNSVIQNLIEFEQYLKASWYNEIGLNANYNMKRESINSGESQLNDDMLLPLVDDMLNCRKKGLEKVNKKYGLDVTVDYNSSWKDNQIELEKIQSGGGNGEQTDTI